MKLDAQTRRKLEELWAQAKWRTYADDPELFFAECLQVPAPGKRKGRVPFVLFDYQAEDLRLMREERQLVILKARQLGLTMLAMAYAFHQLMFNEGSNIVLVSKDRDTSNEALEKTVDFFYHWMPAWTHAVRPQIDDDNAKEHTYLFPDGMRSRIVSAAPTRTSGAGETATLVLWDEAALPDVKTPGIGDAIFTTLSSTTDTTGGQMFVFSTARGGFARFARLYKAARAGASDFKAVFHPWWVSRFLNPLAENLASCPDGPCPRCVDSSIRESKKRDHLERPWEFHAEYPSSDEEAFRGSGRGRFGGLPPVEEFADLGWRGRIMRGPDGLIQLIEDETGPLRLDADLAATGGPPAWALPALSLDPSGGGGGDFAAMIGGWMTRDGVPKITAYWHANDVEPDEQGRQANLLGRFLEGGDRRPALLTVEIAGGHGETQTYVLNDLDYPNLYVHRYTGHRKHRRETRFGMPMNDSRRPLVVDALAHWLRFDIEDLPVIEGIFPLLRYELGSFVITDSGKAQADTGTNDDLVMAAAIWVYTLVEEVGVPEAAVTPHPRSDKQSFQLPDLYAKPEVDRSAKARSDRQFARQVSRGFLR